MTMLHRVTTSPSTGPEVEFKTGYSNDGEHVIIHIVTGTAGIYADLTPDEARRLATYLNDAARAIDHADSIEAEA